MAEINTKRVLYVGSIDDNVTEEIVLAAFAPFGEVLGVQMPVNKHTQKHRGFAFVEFEETGDAAAALDNMHNSELYGKILKLNYAKPEKMDGFKSRAVWNTDAYHNEGEEQNQESENNDNGKEKQMEEDEEVPLKRKGPIEESL